MYDNFAVYVKNVDRSYDGNKVLDDFSMTVGKGTIFGLLGASGCGKTTLLSCIMGRKKTDKGEIWVLGAKPGKKGSNVPGPRVGYMPQDISLFPEYTVRDTVYFFGRIANMSDKTIKKRYDELTMLLNLPNENKYIKECSGGEQRRVSLASAIVHNPELLILDEPTVGVDPILRDKIWVYMIQLVQTERTSVIMTTHYIEECKLADKVGLMRKGKLLAEESPSKIMAAFQAQSLELAFLRLSLEQDQKKVNSFFEKCWKISELSAGGPSTSSSVQSLELDCGSTKELVKEAKKRDREMKTYLGMNKQRIYALMDKNWKQFYRNFSGIMIFLILPIIESICFLYGVGGEMKGMKLGIVNNETSMASCRNYDRNTTVQYDSDMFECYFGNLSCRFLEYLEHPMMEKVHYASLDEATEGIKHGKILGALYINQNFTEAYEDRLKSSILTDDDSLEFSEIKVYMDMTSKQQGAALKFKLIELFLNFQEDLFQDCMWDRRLGGLPVKEEYMYGKKDETFMIFMIPGMVIASAFFFSATMTSHIIVSEKCEGVWERSLAAGVTSAEVTVTHLLFHTVLSLIQGIEPIIIMFYVYGVEYLGTFWNMLIIIFFEGVSGLTFGYWISIISVNHTHGNIILTSLMFPALMLSGLMWPLEGLPYALQIFSKCLPFTLAIDSFRSVVRKGMSIQDYRVLQGVLMCTGWSVVFVGLSLWRIRSNK